MRDLDLTTPHMSGADVETLQILLAKHGWLRDKADGEYGPLTAQAVFRGKYRLGYRKPDHAAGELFYSYAAETRKPSASMRARAKARQRRAAATPLRVKALANLSAHLGEKESPPESNRVPWASLWYGLIGPWCAMAATRAYVDAGSKVFARGVRYAYVPYIVHDARAGVNNLALTTHPKPGDLVCYDWQDDGVADHVGLFERWLGGAEGIEFQAVEGNTGVGNDSNGGEVMRRVRKTRDVQAFVHVGR